MPFKVISKMLGIQGLEVIHTNVNSSIYTVFAKRKHIAAICSNCGRFTNVIHDLRILKTQLQKKLRHFLDYSMIIQN